MARSFGERREYIDAPIFGAGKMLSAETAIAKIWERSMKWEYQLTVLGLNDPKEAQDTLNRLGREGWELVSIASNVGKDGTWHIASLKREIPESQVH